MRDPNNPCLFCTPRSVTRRNALAYCARDSFPVSPGHSLIMPFRHCASFFELSPEEVAACMALVGHERQGLGSAGGAGGQGVLHAHTHLIPRYVGDHPKPRGGVRQILPWKAEYPRGGAPPEETEGVPLVGSGPD